MSQKSISDQDRLKRLRNHIQLSQRELADLLGVSPGALAMWENGDREIPGPVNVLIRKIEVDFGFAADSTFEPSLTDDHFSALLAKKILMNIGLQSSPAQNQLIEETKEAAQEILGRHLSHDQTTRRIQMSLIEKAFLTVADIKGIPIKLLQLIGFFDLGLSHKTRLVIERLQACLSSMPPKRVKAVFLEEFGRGPDELFAAWEDKPFAVASIGQVHRALLPTGEKVAVKVQYPHVYRNVVLQSQLTQMLSYLTALFRKDQSEVLRDFTLRLRNECDYVNEANLQEKYFTAFQGNPEIMIPKVHKDFSGRRVLTSDFVDGLDFRTFARTSSLEERNRAGGILHRMAYESGMRYGLVQGDPHPGNFLFLKDGRIAFVDFGRAIELDPKTAQLQKGLFAAIHSNDAERAREIMREANMIRDWSRFPFDEFWEIQRTQLSFELSPTPVRFDQQRVREIMRLGQSFKERHLLNMTTFFFWSVFTSFHFWTLFAELEAEFTWSENARRALEMG